MPTVVDSFIVEFGLDPKNLNKGRKQVSAGLKTTKDEARRTAQDIEASGKRAAEFFGEMRKQALSFFTVLTAGKGLVNFTKDILQGDAATGRLARSIGVATADLGAWQRVAERTGGTAQGITSSLSTLTDTFEQIKLTGTAANAPYLQALGLKREDLEDSSEALLKISDALSKMDPKRARQFGAALGFDQETVNLLQRGRPAVEAMLKAEKARGGVSDESARKTAELNAELSDLKHNFDEAGRELLVDVLPPATEFLKWMTAATNASPGLTKAIFAIGAAVTALASINLSAGLLGLLGIGRAGGAVAAGGRGLLAGAGRLAVGAVTRVNPIAAGLGLALTPTAANKGEDAHVAEINARRRREMAASGRDEYGNPLRSPTPAAGDTASVTRQRIMQREGFAREAYWDVNHFRTGYGSDTTTNPRTGRVSEVTRGTRVNREEAGADLERRLRDEFVPKAMRAAGAAWDKYNAETRASITSVAYNYGSVPKRIQQAVASGDATQVAAAIRGLQGDNHGVNRGRRNSEADAILTSLQAAGARRTAAQTSAATQTPAGAGAQSNTVNIGTVNVQTRATDAAGIARDIGPALRRSSTLATQANSGAQ